MINPYFINKIATLHQQQVELEQRAKQPPILLVDDRKDNLFTLKKILRNYDYNLISFQSGEEALQWLLDQPNCAVVILDVEMPGINGLETAKLIRKNYTNKNLPIIFMTGFTQNPEIVFEGYALGAIDFITKPIKPFIIKAKVAVLVELHRKTIALEQANLSLQREIIERQQAEEEIRFQYHILEQIQDPVIVVDNNQFITYLNLAAITQYHCTHSNMLGRAITDLYQVQWLNAEDEIKYNEVLETKGCWYGEYLHIKNNGETSYILSTVNEFRDPDNQRVGLIIISHDITARKQIEMALAASRASFRNVVELNPIGIMVINYQDIIMFINPAVQNLLSNYAPLVVGEPFTIPTEMGNHKEMDITRLNGEKGTAEIKVVDTYWEEEPAYLIMLHDVTERQRIAKALQVERLMLAQRIEERTMELKIANAELARSARLKDEFLANMSHELRTPLNSILGNVEMLNEQVFGSINTKQQEIIQRIETSGKHLLRLISDILDLSKISVGQLELAISSISVDLLCQESLQFVQQLAQKKQIKLRFSCDYQITTVRADELRLKQILVNLLTNAIKFTPPGGQIELAIHAQPEHQIVEFIVSDNGIGIDQADLQRLFKPFVQLDAALNRNQEGAGLGLSLVSKLTEMLGGSVSVTSQIGVGSCFTVALPWHPDEENQTPNNITPEHHLTASLIETTPYHTKAPYLLLADDSEATQEMLFNYLVAKQYRVLIARDGAEAVELAKQERPDLILMDIQMPKIDGLEAIHCLRADPVLAQVPIIALTALVMPGDKERCLQAGANAYLSKPIQLKQLLETIEQLLLTSQAS